MVRKNVLLLLHHSNRHREEQSRCKMKYYRLVVITRFRPSLARQPTKTLTTQHTHLHLYPYKSLCPNTSFTVSCFSVYDKNLDFGVTYTWSTMLTRTPTYCTCWNDVFILGYLRLIGNVFFISFHYTWWEMCYCFSIPYIDKAKKYYHLDKCPSPAASGSGHKKDYYYDYYYYWTTN